MTTGTAEKITAQMLKEPKLICARKFLILGLNRDRPGFGDDAVLVDCQTGLGQPLSGRFWQGTRISKSEKYCAACDEYRENGWAAGTDERDSEDGLYDDPDEENSGDVEDESTVIVPEYANFIVPSTELEVSYCCDDISRENTTERKSDSCCFDMIEVPFGLSFHINRTMDGIIIDKDFFDFPLVCWNTGSLPIKVDGKKILAGAHLILSSDNPKRKERRLYYGETMSIPIWDSEARIARNEKLLLALGCPAGDAHVLAAYFWRSSFDSAVDYDLVDHTLWMNEVRREGGPRLQG